MSAHPESVGVGATVCALRLFPVNPKRKEHRCSALTECMRGGGQRQRQRDGQLSVTAMAPCPIPEVNINQDHLKYPDVS